MKLCVMVAVPLLASACTGTSTRGVVSHSHALQVGRPQV